MAYVAATFAEVGDIRALAQLMAEELQKIEEELYSAQGGATLVQDQPLVTGVANIIPRVLDEFDVARPNRDFRAVVPNLPDGQIIAARSGQYLVNFTVTAVIGLNRAYELRLFLNNNPTNLIAVADPSNQTDIVTLVATGTARVARESERDILDLRISSDQDGAQFDMKESFFTSAWIGD